MKIVKLLVTLFCAIVVHSYNSGYCEICRNHTLCKYTVSGPTAKCKAFDNRALLSDQDIVEIVNRINARRNLVATGRLKRFPQAANMRKMRWSTELASFAQRWADQCDPSVRPNKEDDCRDLVGMKVGQSIAAVLGPTQGLNVKSFIDMWFMLQLHYTGNIVYYNQSRDAKTNYFTQLIWAETEYVGCGKVKFFNQDVNTVVERLVCNFTPKGNNHGKPVYTLGYPATQCPKFMGSDDEFPGLCKQGHETATETVSSSAVRSLLRILDLSNNSTKQELDPNNIKQIQLNSSETKDQRNQKTRHTNLNDRYGAIKRDSFHMQNPLSPISDPENFKGRQFTNFPERGHSRMYHGHQTKIEPIQNFQSTQPLSEQDFKRFDLTTTAFSFSSHDHDHNHAPNSRRIMNNQNDYAPDGRRLINNQNDYVIDGRRNQNGHVCTRKPKCDDGLPKPCVTNQCTRGQSHSCSSCLKAQPCNSVLQMPLPPVLPSHDLCPCKTTCSNLPSPCDFNMNCPVCTSHDCPPSGPTQCYLKRRMQGDTHDASKSTQFNYYDLFPNIGVRSGDENVSVRKHFDNSEIEDSLENKANESELSKQVKEFPGNLQMNIRRPQDSYGIFYSSERKRRDFEEQMTFRPFWQMDEYNYKRPSELKSLRYTTLGNKRNRKTRKTTIYERIPTESITIQLDDEIIDNRHDKDHITEKYLSFEELMHLRKLSTLEALDYEARRLGDGFLREAKKDAKKTVNTTNKKTKNKTVASTTKKGIKTTKKATTAKKVTAATKSADTNKKTATAAAKKVVPATPTKVAPAAPKNAAPTASKNVAPTAHPQKPPAPPTTTTELTTITANTPFIRLKQCTRKLTCTWTAMMMTGSDGIPLLPDGAGGGIIEIGSRTPPGYVDGCTRTSTCTRDFMDRNKMSTSSEEDSSEEFTTLDDADGGDYCEKRSLSVQRRNLDDADKMLSIEFQDALTEMTLSTPEISHVTNRDISDDQEIPQYKHSDCICYEDFSRVKRDENSKYEQLLSKGCAGMKDNGNSKNLDTYDDNYYSRLKKMSRPSKLNKIPHQCSCNGTKSIRNIFCWTILLKCSFTWMCYNVFLSNCKI